MGRIAIISLTFSLFSDYMLARDQAEGVIKKRIRGRYGKIIEGQFDGIG